MGGESNLYNAFVASCRENSQRPLFYVKKKETPYDVLTYSFVHKQVVSLSRQLSAQGVSAGNRYALIMDNSPLWAIGFFALLKLNAVAVPLNPQLDAEELTALLDHAEVSGILTTSTLGLKLSERTQNTIPHFILDTLYADENPLAAEKDQQTPENNPQSLAVLVYTSGTTATPRGVMLTHANIIAEIASLQALHLLDSNDCLIALLPFYHTYALTVNLLLPIFGGARISFPTHIDVHEILACMRETHVTVLVGVPRLFSLFGEKIKTTLYPRAWLKRTPLVLMLRLGTFIRTYCHFNVNLWLLHSLHCKFGKQFRFMICGGAQLNKEIGQLLYAWGFTILEGYGLTETSPVATSNVPGHYKLGSAGKAIPGVEVSIYQGDEQGTGEVIIRGKNVMQGYFKEKVLSDEVIKNGWFFTGDIGCIDRDGFLFITGRKKEIIVLSTGKKIVPEDVEAHYGKTPFIEEICVHLHCNKKGFLRSFGQIF